MASDGEKRSPNINGEKLLTQGEVRVALRALRDGVDYAVAAHLSSCVHCGLCADSCHYYLTKPEPEAVPAYKLNLVLSVLKKQLTLLGRKVPRLSSTKDLDDNMVASWVDSLFGRCSLCGRCTLNCTMGINIHALVRLGRTALAAIDRVPVDLQSTVTTAVETGNNMGIPKSDWLDTVRWLEEELQQEVSDPEARLPLDQKDANVFYTVNPREPKFFPLSLLATAKIFYAAKESWTLSSEHYDVTNYGLFSGDDKAAGTISQRLLQTARQLGARTLVLGECGHGFNANRWEAPEWLATEYGIEVRSIIEIVADYIRRKRIIVDPSKNPKRVTLHDPCNLVRLGGIIEEQRYILKSAVTDFVEMYPNRERNFCCGGGGGQLSMSRFSERRLKAGQVKAEQIRQTGAKVVVAPCHNCIDQLTELNKHYRLGVEVKTLSEIVADALVIS